jgi:hypothetical protein
MHLLDAHAQRAAGILGGSDCRCCSCPAAAAAAAEAPSPPSGFLLLLLLLPLAALPLAKRGEAPKPLLLLPALRCPGAAAPFGGLGTLAGPCIAQQSNNVYLNG